MIKHIVTSDEVGKRADIVATSAAEQLNRSNIKKLFDQNKVFLNSKPIKPKKTLNINDILEIDFDINILAQEPVIELPIIYEDDNCLVIDKPSGILTHSKGAFNPEPTVASFIRRKLTDLTGDRAGIVHRLDRDTSGVIICAKNPTSLTWLQKQFSQRKVEKTYIAAVSGMLKHKTAKIDMPIARNPKKPKTFKVDQSGRSAITNYELLGSNSLGKIVKIKPLTGRTHQIRVHFKHLGNPIVGDKFYDGSEAERLMLHAYQLKLHIPGGEQKTFTSKPPSELTVEK